MPLITRQEKGSKLTIAEMDGNLEYLESNGFIDGEYSQLTQEIPSQLGTGEIVDLSELVQSSIVVPGVPGTYTVSPTTDGAGEGAEFELVLISIPDAGDRFSTSVQIDYDASSIINGGSGYAEGDTLTILRTDLGDLGLVSSIFEAQLVFTVTEASLDTVTGVPATKTYINVNVTDTEKSIYLAVNEEVFELNDSNDEFIQIGGGSINYTPFISLYQFDGQDEFPESGGRGDAIPIDGSPSSQITISTGINSSPAATNPGIASIDLYQETNQGITNGAVSISTNRNQGSFSAIENFTEPPSSQIDLDPDSLILTNGASGKFGSDKSTVTIDSTSITLDTIGLFLPNIPEYEDNAAALSDEYQADGVYKTPTGELRIVVASEI